MITSYATPKFPSSDCSYDVQIWPLSFAPGLTHLLVPPCTKPSTTSHIQESDVQVTCRLSFWSVLINDLFTFCFIFYLSLTQNIEMFSVTKERLRLDLFSENVYTRVLITS